MTPISKVARLSAATLVLACTSEPTPPANDASDEARASPSDEVARTECLRIRDDFTTGTCRLVTEQWRILGCETGSPDDPACSERKPARRTCMGKIADYAKAHDLKAHEPDDLDPSAYTCKFPPPPPTPKKSSPDPLPALQDDALSDAACAKQYVRLRDFPHVDRAMLEYAWRSNECQRRHNALLGALPEAERVAWAEKWQASGSDGTQSWRPPPFEASVRDRVLAAMNTWCAEKPCSVLGRCVAEILPADHPTFPGALTCVARDDAACKSSRACEVDGRCQLDPATSMCVAENGGGEMTPETSGIDTIAFIDNPALGRRKAVIEVESESVDGPHSKVMTGLSKEQHADVSACMDRRLALAPAAAGTFEMVLHLQPGGPRVTVTNRRSNTFDDGRVFEECLERKATEWTFPAAEGSSRLWLVATFRGE